MEDVGIVERLKAFPCEIHVVFFKRIMKYIQGTTKYGMWCAKNEEFKLKEYTNTNWVGNLDERKSISRANLFLGKCLVSWVSKKQTSISLSTAEEKNIIVAICCTQTLWIKKVL